MYKNNGNKHKMFSNKNHMSRIGGKSTETRQLTSNIPTYNTMHFYNPTSLRVLCYCHALSVVKVISHASFDIQLSHAKHTSV